MKRLPERYRAAILGLAALAAGGTLSAHEIAPSYLSVAGSDSGSSLVLRWDLPLTELRWIVDLDGNGDGSIDWSEVTPHEAPIQRLAAESLELDRGGQRCTLVPDGLQPVRHVETDYVSIGMQARCPASGSLALRNRLFFGDHPTHQLLLEAATPNGRFASALNPLSSGWNEPEAPSWLGTLGEFVRHGVWHIWIGYDHLAFLVLLLLPSVLGKAVVRDVVLIVTAFTLAHSITLGLAATGTMTLPDRPVEIAIAASIVVAGLLNLFPRIARARIPLAFAFGLVHGFGFANALAELGESGAPRVPMLAGFNLGVELGQLAIVAVALPVLLWLRRQPAYATRLMPVASLLTATAGAFWIIQRW